jgi:transcription initiation factor TFIID subunit 6
MRVANAILHSQHLNAEPYLHQLMPSILTCVVGRYNCGGPLEDHWSLRQYAAGLVGVICRYTTRLSLSLCLPSLCLQP